MSDSFVTLQTVARQAPLSMGLPRQEYWSGFPFPPLEDLPDPGIKPMSPTLQVDSLPLSHLGSPMLLGFYPNNLNIFIHKKQTNKQTNKQEKIHSRVIHNHKIVKLIKIHLVAKWINCIISNNVEYYLTIKRNELSRHGRYA